MGHECVSSGSGKVTLLSASAAFLILTMTMMAEHTYILIGVSKQPPLEAVGWEPDFRAALPWQAGFLFVMTWVCFVVAEILLLIGLSVESGHLKDWSTRRTGCLVIHQGLFCTAGILALATVLLSAGLYLTDLSLQENFQELDLARRQMIKASVMYASPTLSPVPHTIPAVPREDPVIRNEHQRSSPPVEFHSLFTKS